MRTALLHYWLTNVRGGEKVFRALCGMFPEGDVFTHAIGAGMTDRSDGEGVKWLGHRVTESFIARLPFGRRRPQAYLPLMPRASRALTLDGYDLIVSSESGPIKGVRKPAGARHVCYCHTPMRYVWDLYDEYYRREGALGRMTMRVFRDYLRRADLKSAESVDMFVANSEFVAERIRRIYGREATVVHPFADYAYFSAADRRVAEDGHYLLAGQLTGYKRPEVAVRACMKMGRKLRVVGTGDMLGELRKLAAGNSGIEFLGRVDDGRLRAEYAAAKALLFPGVEDFGIVPVEAQAAGAPVIALGSGGARESVVAEGENATGVLFAEPTAESMCSAIERFEARGWSPSACRASAARFTEEEFVTRMSVIFGIDSKGG